MGFFFRKSVNFGLFRFNFSKKGVGVSTGVKGARISVGPTGKYLSLGRNGFYFRKKIDVKSNSHTPSSITQSSDEINSITNNKLVRSNTMKYLTIFGIIPSFLILGFVTYKCCQVEIPRKVTHLFRGRLTR
jgi:hypothetical protein